jgi:HK97 family phage major capsid protein
MKKTTKDELQVRNREIQDRMAELNDKAYNEKREFTEEEAREWNALSREKTMNLDALRDMATDAELAKMREYEDKNAKLREILSDRTHQREITLFAAAPGSTSNITASGAIQLSIHELIPTLHEGLDLPSTLRVVTGVVGDEIWPVNVDDVEMEEVGEVQQLNDQVVNFANIQPSQKRVGLKVPVSNMAIDNAAFDLMSFVQTKFTLALRKYLAKKIYSQANWTGNKGPFSNLTPKGTISLASGHAYKDILKAVAEFSDKGFYEGNVVLIMDRTTEAELKATPKIPNAAGGFIIENGLCAGYPYVLTHYINTELSGTALVPTSSKAIGIGYFEWFALQQHGEVRMVVDPITKADYGVTRVILNTAWSMTDLSKYINGGTPVSDGEGGYTYPTQAFALYTVEFEEDEPTTT